LAAQIVQLRRLNTRQLRERYREVFGHDTATAHKQHLVRRIAWRLQSLRAGDLSERARRRATEIANDADLRVTVSRDVMKAASAPVEQPIEPPPPQPPPSRRQFMAGAKLTRLYQGRRLTVQVVEDGFEFEGERYRSLSAVARAATGTRWNGLLFFGVAERRKAPSAPS
jgi:hypothetical protein